MVVGSTLVGQESTRGNIMQVAVINKNFERKVIDIDRLSLPSILIHQSASWWTAGGVGVLKEPPSEERYRLIEHARIVAGTDPPMPVYMQVSG